MAKFSTFSQANRQRQRDCCRLSRICLYGSVYCSTASIGQAAMYLPFLSVSHILDLLVSSKSDNVDRIKLLIKNNSSSTGSKERLYETRSEKDPFPLQFEEVRRSGEFRRIRIPELVAWNTTAHEEEQQVPYFANDVTSGRMRGSRRLDAGGQRHYRTALLLPWTVV